MNIVPGNTYNASVVTPGRKDAFHVAAILCRKGKDSKFHIDPGDRMVIVSDTDAVYFDDDVHSDWDGIADPYAESIGRESLFWVFLRPERYRDLRHVFTLTLPEQIELEPRPTNNDGDWNKACKKCES